jgi:hypothetical protein
MSRLLTAASLGAETWQQVGYGLITEQEGVASNPWPLTDRRGYAAWRKGYEEARERTIREFPI